MTPLHPQAPLALDASNIRDTPLALAPRDAKSPH